MMPPGILGRLGDQLNWKGLRQLECLARVGNLAARSYCMVARSFSCFRATRIALFWPAMRLKEAWIGARNASNCDYEQGGMTRM